LFIEQSAEIIQEPTRHESDAEAKAFYEQEMTRAFAEARRVLHPDGIFVVVFAHESTAASSAGRLSSRDDRNAGELAAMVQLLPGGHQAVGRGWE
jgi:hypothetical protein